MPDRSFPSNQTGTPIGLMALIQELDLPVRLPAVQSWSRAGARKTSVTSPAIKEYYPPGYAPQGFIGNLKFALRYEPVDLSIYYPLFKVVESELLEEWIRREPTSAYARRAWFLYEFLTGKTLDAPDVPPTGYVNILDPKLHVTGPVRKIRRQRVNNNLLGDHTYCPVIRRTDVLNRAMSAGLDLEARSLVDSCEPTILTRAVHYLYTKETKSSFAIEGEVPNAKRTERFVAALTGAANFDTSDPHAFINLQNAIVDPRYAATGWRTVQSFIGETMSDFREHVHYVCPKPDDLANLMNGWMRMMENLRGSNIDPICAAAAASFGFVFIHPFEDGNGRIHRFLVHQQLASFRFTPSQLLFPVSAVMLRDRRRYDEVLEGFSQSVSPFIDSDLNQEGSLLVNNETAHLYRFWDATAFAEYLYDCVAETIHTDLKQEIGLLKVFDAAIRATMEVVDMPDRRASLLVRLVLQNKGRLSQVKRATFSELSDEEIAAIEAAVASCTQGSLSEELTLAGDIEAAERVMHEDRDALKKLAE
ncbi:MAG: Fic family protein [Pyrinomonadaceae bacterium]